MSHCHREGNSSSTVLLLLHPYMIVLKHIATYRLYNFLFYFRVLEASVTSFRSRGSCRFILIHALYSGKLVSSLNIEKAGVA